MANEQFLELIDEVRKNINTFTELLVAVVKAFIVQARSGRSYMPTHAEFDWWDKNNEKQGEIKWIECIMTSPNGVPHIFDFSAQTNPRWLYDHVYYLIQTYEQPKKDVNQYDNRTDKTST